jgi:toxin FitB
MLILDTNVVSELMKPAPEPAVTAWLRRQRTDCLATTAVTVAEIRYGLDRLSDGKRKAELSAKFQAVLTRALAQRVLPFDRRATESYALLKGSRERAGRPISPFDAMIAAIARVHGAAVATRNVADFAACGVDIFDPWRSKARQP